MTRTSKIRDEGGKNEQDKRERKTEKRKWVLDMRKEWRSIFLGMVYTKH